MLHFCVSCAKRGKERTDREVRPHRPLLRVLLFGSTAASIPQTMRQQAAHGRARVRAGPFHSAAAFTAGGAIYTHLYSVYMCIYPQSATFALVNRLYIGYHIAIDGIHGRIERTGTMAAEKAQLNIQTTAEERDRFAGLPGETNADKLAYLLGCAGSAEFRRAHAGHAATLDAFDGLAAKTRQILAGLIETCDQIADDAEGRVQKAKEQAARLVDEARAARDAADARAAESADRAAQADGLEKRVAELEEALDASEAHVSEAEQAARKAAEDAQARVEAARAAQDDAQAQVKKAVERANEAADRADREAAKAAQAAQAQAEADRRADAAQAETRTAQAEARAVREERDRLADEIRGLTARYDEARKAVEAAQAKVEAAQAKVEAAVAAQSRAEATAQARGEEIARLREGGDRK